MPVPFGAPRTSIDISHPREIAVTVHPELQLVAVKLPIFVSRGLPGEKIRVNFIVLAEQLVTPLRFMDPVPMNEFPSPNAEAPQTAKLNRQILVGAALAEDAEIIPITTAMLAKATAKDFFALT